MQCQVLSEIKMSSASETHHTRQPEHRALLCEVGPCTSRPGNLSFLQLCSYVPLDLAGFVLAVGTLQPPIGATPEPLRISCIHNLPPNQHHTGGKKQAPAKKVTDKQHGSKHHKMSPVINPAIDTALIFHYPRLERTIKQYADIVHQKIKHRQHN